MKFALITIAKNIKLRYNQNTKQQEAAELNENYVTPFETRQDMIRADFEIFYRNDAALFEVPMHSHAFFELNCVMSGSALYRVGGQTYTLTPDSLLLIAPGETHHAVCEGAPHAVERIVLWLNAGYILSLNGMLPRIKPTLMEGLKGRGLITPDRETCQFLHGQLLSLLHEKQLADSDSAYLSRLIVAELMVYLTRHLSRASGHADPHALKQDPDILRVYDYIGMHYSERLNIAQLSERFYMDKNTLTRRFKRLVGQTPGDYLRARRLDAARRMIAHGAGMQEACDSCGFSDYSAFYRAFRRAYGISPSAASGNAAGNGERA